MHALTADLRLKVSAHRHNIGHNVSSMSCLYRYGCIILIFIHQYMEYRRLSIIYTAHNRVCDKFRIRHDSYNYLHNTHRHETLYTERQSTE